MRRILMRFAALLLTICRGAYCCMFFLSAFCLIWAISAGLLRMARTHSFDGADIFVYTVFGIYSIVFAFAWWTIFVNKPVSKQWAIAANLILAIPPVPVLIAAFWHWRIWRGFVESERDWWVATLIGFVGIVTFSIPYHGQRRKSQMPVDVLP
jgi:hypothetical protein